MEVRTITDYLKENGWHEILSMDKNEILLFIAERLDQITMMEQGRYSGKITREEQKVCFTCGRTPQLMSAALLNFYQLQAVETEKPKRRRKKRASK